MAKWPKWQQSLSTGDSGKQPHFVDQWRCKQTTGCGSSRPGWERSSRLTGLVNNWTQRENSPSCWTPRDECAVYVVSDFFWRPSAGRRRVTEVNRTIEFTMSGPRPRPAGPLNTNHGSDHLFMRGKSIKWDKLSNLQVTITWLWFCLSALGFLVLGQFLQTAASLCNWKHSATPLHQHSSGTRQSVCKQFWSGSQLFEAGVGWLLGNRKPLACWE